MFNNVAYICVWIPTENHFNQKSERKKHERLFQINFIFVIGAAAAAASDQRTDEIYAIEFVATVTLMKSIMRIKN